MNATMNEPLRRLAVVAIVMAIVLALHFGWLVPMGLTASATTLLLLGIFVCATYGGVWPGLGATLISVTAALVSWRLSPVATHETIQLVLLGVAGVLTSLMA